MSRNPSNIVEILQSVKWTITEAASTSADIRAALRGIKSSGEHDFCPQNKHSEP